MNLMEALRRSVETSGAAAQSKRKAREFELRAVLTRKSSRSARKHAAELISVAAHRTGMEQASQPSLGVETLP